LLLVRGQAWRVRAADGLKLSAILAEWRHVWRSWTDEGGKDAPSAGEGWISVLVASLSNSCKKYLKD